MHNRASFVIFSAPSCSTLGPCSTFVLAPCGSSCSLAGFARLLVLPKKSSSSSSSHPLSALEPRSAEPVISLSPSRARAVGRSPSLPLPWAPTHCGVASRGGWRGVGEDDPKRLASRRPSLLRLSVGLRLDESPPGVPTNSKSYMTQISINLGTSQRHRTQPNRVHLVVSRETAAADLRGRGAPSWSWACSTLARLRYPM